MGTRRRAPSASRCAAAAVVGQVVPSHRSIILDKRLAMLRRFTGMSAPSSPFWLFLLALGCYTDGHNLTPERLRGGKLAFLRRRERSASCPTRPRSAAATPPPSFSSWTSPAPCSSRSAASRTRRKADGVADALNRLLQNLVLKCAKADGIRDFFHVGMISYGGRVARRSAAPWPARPSSPSASVANNPLRVEDRTRKVDDGAGGLIEQKVKFPVWFEAAPTGRTPMCEALGDGTGVPGSVPRPPSPKCYPPIVINITDGQPTDGDPREAAKELRALASKDGNVLLFNAHLSDKQNRPIEFPRTECDLPDDFARLLFRMSSELPPKLVDAARRPASRSARTRAASSSTPTWWR